MKRFITLTTTYLVALLSILLVYLLAASYFVDRQTFENHQTDSNLLVMGESQNHDLLFMGISHARNFSRHQNHQRVEGILNKTILNLGQGNGTCGVNEQLFYLDYFYQKENTSPELVYFISPPLFFSNALALSTNTFDQEPFRVDFLNRYRNFPAELQEERMISYLQSKYSPRWLMHQPFSEVSMDEQLNRMDPMVVEEGQRLAYGDTLDIQRFQKSILKLEETIQLALGHQTKVILIIPPALFGQWEGHQEVAKFARQMAKLEGVQFFDFSETIQTPEYYYDHHHLNTAGVTYFTENYLKPILNNR